MYWHVWSFVLSGTLAIESKSKKKNIKTSFSYNVGRIISYTVIGAIIGGIGEVITLSKFFKGLLPIVSAALMIILGLNFLGFFKKINLSFKINRIIANKILNNNSKNMFIIGLATGLLPCGPMQAMQLYSLATGSLIKGALSMFIFAIGTVPLLFGFGVISGILNGKFKKYILKFSSALLITMGVFMALRGLNFWGINLSSVFLDNRTTNKSEVSESEQVLTTKYSHNNSLWNVSFKKGVPVKWTIIVDKKYVGDMCSTLEIPEYNIKIQYKEGKNIIKFTPKEAKTITYSSWCGMHSGTITIYN